GRARTAAERQPPEGLLRKAVATSCGEDSDPCASPDFVEDALVGRGARWLACAGLLAAAAAAPFGRTPPRVGGPLTQQDVPSCLIAGPAQACRFDYTLDPASTNDPTDRWYAFWGSAFLTDRIPSGYCTTEVGTLLEWQRAAAGALPTATYP